MFYIGEGETVYFELLDCYKENKKNGIKTGVFCKNGSEYECECIIHWGENAEDMAATMFSALRDFDKSGVDEILCEMPEEHGIGSGVRNRIYKSAGFDIRWNVTYADLT